MSGNSIIIECSEQGKNTFTRKNNGDYSCNIAPIKIEKGDVVELKSAFIDSVSSSSGKCNIRPDVVGGDTAELSFTFGYYAVDHAGTQDNVNPSKSFLDFAGQSLNHPNGKTYALNQFKSANPSADAKKLIEIKVPFKGGKGSTISQRKNCYQLVLAALAKASTNPLEPDNVPFQFIFDAGFKNIDKYVDANGLMTFTDAIIKDMLVDGFMVFGAPQSISLNLSGYDQTPSARQVFPPGINSLPFDRGGSLGFGQVASIAVDDFGNNETLNQIYTKTISFSVEAKSYDPHDLAELITDKMTNPLLEGTLPADNFTITRNPLLTTARTLRNDPLFQGQAAQFFHPTQGRLSFSSSAGGTDPDYFIGTSQFGLVYDDVTDAFKFSQIHSSLFSTDPNEKTPAPLVQLVSDGSGGKTLLNKSGGIFFTSLTPADIFIGENSVFKFDSSILVNPVPQSFVDNAGVKVNFETVNLQDGVNITGDLQGLDSLVQKQAIAPTPPGDPNGKGFDIVPTLPFSTAVTLTDSINAVNSFTSNREAFFKLEVKLPNIRQKVYLNHLPPTDDGFAGETTINTDIQAIIGRYYNANNFTSAYNEGSIPYVYNEDEPTILSEVQIRILDPDGSVASGLGNKNTVFLQIQKNNNNI